MAKKFNFSENIVSNTLIRVNYRDTDRMGVVYYANYFVWFEAGRVELLRRFGSSYRDIEEKGIILPVKKCECNYIKSACFDDIVRVETRIRELTKISITFDYKIYLYPDNEELASGMTEHIFINPGGKIQRFGDKIFQIFTGCDKKTLEECQKPLSNIS